VAALLFFVLFPLQELMIFFNTKVTAIIKAVIGRPRLKKNFGYSQDKSFVVTIDWYILL
jgi:hypothetical protein